MILKVDGTDIDDQSSQLPGLIASKKPGSTVDLDVWRDGGTQAPQREAGRDRRTRPPRCANRDDVKADETAKLGLVVRPLQKQEKRTGRDRRRSCVVEDLDGPAAAAGVQRGDIILGVNGKPVKSAGRSSKTAARKSKGKVVRVADRTQTARQIFVPVRMTG